MRVTCFTSFTYAYLNRARVLFRSLRRHHPDWTLVALVTDRPPPGIHLDLAAEDFDRLAFFDELGLSEDWLFGHDIIEACTAVKGPMLAALAEDGQAEAVIYLDPDTAVLNPLDTVLEGLARHDGLLTPHLLEPEEEEQALLDNELATLRTGIFNLGFLAIRTRGDGLAFARWWRDRLLAYCHDDIPRGLFTDQRWCDHVPAFFPNFGILRDPGCNVASWNLSRRKISIGPDGVARVNGEVLRFWHFTKLGPTGDTMTRRYARDNYPVYEIWNWYRREIAEATDARIPERYWAFDTYDDGRRIEKSHRVLYRTRPDLQAAFHAPFATGADSYAAWLETQGLLTPNPQAAGRGAD